MTAGRVFVRLAGVSGALAVSAGAYNAHTFKLGQADENQQQTYDTANRYHFIHTLALLGVPHCRRPILAGSLLTAGTVLFCGSCYAHALELADGRVRSITPFGGMCLIAGWLALAL
ncbi:transmembrane protein 256 homolog [Petromyzon marinus]|uniref:Transmembrane protein 256 homolog n=1 Tax=Petromyzon marinus TaxID=7757 RepID=A0AAJ7THM2_PETMA|nr:transmembrane protein 256 homolog [Petromyzon marinus]